MKTGSVGKWALHHLPKHSGIEQSAFGGPNRERERTDSSDAWVIAVISSDRHQLTDLTLVMDIRVALLNNDSG